MLLHGLSAEVRKCQASSSSQQQPHASIKQAVALAAEDSSLPTADVISSAVAEPARQSWLRAALHCPCTAVSRAIVYLRQSLGRLSSHAHSTWALAQQRLRSLRLRAALPWGAVPGHRSGRLLLEDEDKGAQNKRHRVDIAALYEKDLWEPDEELEPVVGGRRAAGVR